VNEIRPAANGGYVRQGKITWHKNIGMLLERKLKIEKKAWLNGRQPGHFI